MVLGCLAVLCFILLLVGGVMYEELLLHLGTTAAHASLAAAALGAILLGGLAVKAWRTPAPPDA